MNISSNDAAALAPENVAPSVQPGGDPDFEKGLRYTATHDPDGNERPMFNRHTFSRARHPPVDGPNNIFERRWFFLGAVGLLVGPTGCGKSTLANQAALLWSLGRDCCGMVPRRALRILVVQREDSQEDEDEYMYEIGTGLVAQGKLTDAELSRALDSLVSMDIPMRGQMFCESLRMALHEEDKMGNHIDLVIVNPLYCYIDCDINDNSGMGEFFRDGLESVAKEVVGFYENNGNATPVCNCAILVVHHEPKPDKDGKRDAFYCGAGASEINNSVRMSMAMQRHGDKFTLEGGKRRERLGWTAEDGNGGRQQTFKRSISRPATGICWIDNGPLPVRGKGGLPTCKAVHSGNQAETARAETRDALEAKRARDIAEMVLSSPDDLSATEVRSWATKELGNSDLTSAALKRLLEAPGDFGLVVVSRGGGKTAQKKVLAASRWEGERRARLEGEGFRPRG